jgi:hypothetical protein
MLTALRESGWPVEPPRRRMRDGILTVPWSEVAPGGAPWSDVAPGGASRATVAPPLP